jgi:hypothetical protein
MKASYVLIVTGLVGTIVTLILSIYSQYYFNLVGTVIGLISFILGIYWERENRKTAQLNLEENRLQHLQIYESIEKLEKRVKVQGINEKKVGLVNSKLRQLMAKVTLNLGKEHFSKDELLRRLARPVYCLLFHKTEEASLSDKKLKTLRDEILPSLGFKFVRGSRGVYILPPSQLPFFQDRSEIEKWIEDKIISKIPSDYRYIFSFVSLIDLRFTISIKRDKLAKKYDTLMETIDAEELLTFSEGLTYLQSKKNLSLKDIIEIPNLFFLSDKTSLDFDKRNILKDKNEEIIKIIKNEFKKEIFTRDLAEIDSTYLLNLLKKYIQIKDDDVETIKANAKFWEDLLTNNFN